MVQPQYIEPEQNLEFEIHGKDRDLLMRVIKGTMASQSGSVEAVAHQVSLFVHNPVYVANAPNAKFNFSAYRLTADAQTDHYEALSRTYDEIAAEFEESGEQLPQVLIFHRKPRPLTINARQLFIRLAKDIIEYEEFEGYYEPRTILKKGEMYAEWIRLYARQEVINQMLNRARKPDHDYVRIIDEQNAIDIQDSDIYNQLWTALRLQGRAGGTQYLQEVREKAEEWMLINGRTTRHVNLDGTMSITGPDVFPVEVEQKIAEIFQQIDMLMAKTYMSEAYIIAFAASRWDKAIDNWTPALQRLLPNNPHKMYSY